VGDEGGLEFEGFFEEGEGMIGGGGAVWEVSVEGMGGEELEGGEIVEGGEVDESADADVAGGDTGEDGAGEGEVAVDDLAGGGDGEASGGGDAEGVEGFAEEIFAEHGAEGGAAVAVAGVGGGAWAFELEIEAGAGGGEEFAEEDGASVAESGEVAELVTGVGLGDGGGGAVREVSVEGMGGEELEGGGDRGGRRSRRKCRRGCGWRRCG